MPVEKIKCRVYFIHLTSPSSKIKIVQKFFSVLYLSVMKWGFAVCYKAFPAYFKIKFFYFWNFFLAEFVQFCFMCLYYSLGKIKNLTIFRSTQLLKNAFIYMQVLSEKNGYFSLERYVYDFGLKLLIFYDNHKHARNCAFFRR